MIDTEHNSVRQGGLLFTIVSPFVCLLIISIIVSLDSNQTDYISLIITQIISSIVIFVGAAFISSWYTFGSAKFILKNRPLSARILLLAIALIFVCQPFVEYLAYINEQVCYKFNYDFLSINKPTNELLSQIIVFDTPINIFITIFVICLLPAICEELYFRATLQRVIEQKTQNAKIAIIATSMFFSLFHGQIEGFLPRLLLGIILSLIYYINRNLLINIIIHFVNNLVVIAVIFLSDNSVLQIISQPTENPGPIMPILSVLLLLYIIYNLNKYKSRLDM